MPKTHLRHKKGVLFFCVLKNWTQKRCLIFLCPKNGHKKGVSFFWLLEYVSRIEVGGGVAYVVCCSIFHIQKGVQVILGIKLNIRNMSSVTMLKDIIKKKKGLVIIYN